MDDPILTALLSIKEQIQKEREKCRLANRARYRKLSNVLTPLENIIEALEPEEVKD